MTDLTLQDIDRDEVLIEAVAELHGRTRADFLRTVGLGGGILLSALASPAEAARSSATSTSSISACASSACRRPSTRRPKSSRRSRA